MSEVYVWWVRLPRGRVWHLCFNGAPPYCGEYAVWKERLPNGIPEGARVCPRCVERFLLVERLVMAARAQESFITGQPAAPNEYGTIEYRATSGSFDPSVT